MGRQSRKLGCRYARGQARLSARTLDPRPPGPHEYIPACVHVGIDPEIRRPPAALIGSRTHPTENSPPLHAWLRTGTQVRTEPERRHPGGVEVGNTSVHACELHRTNARAQADVYARQRTRSRRDPGAELQLHNKMGVHEDNCRRLGTGNHVRLGAGTPAGRARLSARTPDPRPPGPHEYIPACVHVGHGLVELSSQTDRTRHGCEHAPMRT